MTAVTKAKTNTRRKRKISSFLAWRRRVLGRRLGDILVHSHQITDEQLVEALKEHRKTRKPIGTILVLQGAISPNTLIKTLKRQFYQKVFVVFIILLGCLMSL